MTNLVQINNLTYRKNNKTILQDVNLTLSAGHFVGLAGANGAGKTTLMRLIAGVAKNYQGQIMVGGSSDEVAKKAIVSYSDELLGFNRQTTIQDVVYFYQTVYPDFSSERYQNLSQFLKLKNTDRLSVLSKGTKERLTIALTLARQASLYLLDEPFSGIDVMSRKQIIQGMLNWVSETATVVISSHHLEEIANILDELVIIKQQTILEHRSTDDILEQEHLSIEDYFESLYQGDENYD
ncbi:ATP-binding cassette domain-containing protein [Bombilactobacillus bombi]|uniref:ATP-binding cassette domain-containing protein n=1 Tax=Bombilactobacillus bombi TaxID=1303590 RepID=UPI0015E5E126|nr:ABC transporter ATP-binding protein [Bombilactobacillus bombi]MBA1434045.1 ABC transporter ATP-binding protein [Bombilactobacillus bombi]